MQSKFEVIKMSPQNTNSVLVSCGDQCIIFDAWGRAKDWEKLLQSRGLTLQAIYSTHGHADHISAAPDLANKFNINWYMNHQDLFLMDWNNQLLMYFGLPSFSADTVKPKDFCAGKSEVLPGVTMQTFETPGHSKGGLVFYFPDLKCLITGDTIFNQGIGRYDLPGGNPNELMQSLKMLKDLNLPDDTYVVHGHGPDSTIGELKKLNEYF